MSGAAGEPADVRIDVWLWRARFFRTRALSAEYVRSSGVRLTQAGQTRRIDKPGANLAVGEIVTFRQGENILSVEVLDLGTRRGPAAEARALYRVLEAGP